MTPPPRIQDQKILYSMILSAIGYRLKFGENLAEKGKVIRSIQVGDPGLGSPGVSEMHVQLPGPSGIKIEASYDHACQQLRMQMFYANGRPLSVEFVAPTRDQFASFMHNIGVENVRNGGISPSLSGMIDEIVASQFISGRIFSTLPDPRRVAFGIEPEMTNEDAFSHANKDFWNDAVKRLEVREGPVARSAVVAATRSLPASDGPGI